MPADRVSVPPADQFLAAVSPNLRQGLSALAAPALQAKLEALLAEARAAWPELPVPDEELLAYLAQRLPENLPASEALTGLWPGDLLLACGCVAGRSDALRAFEAHALPEVAVTLRGSEPAFVDEVTALVRERALVGGPQSPPKLADYRGRGPLRGWIRAMALRTAATLRRRPRPEVPAEDWLLGTPVDGADLELQVIKQRYRTQFQEAFRGALGALSPRDRNVLRLHAVDGLNLEKLGAMYGRNRSTLARWIASAREQLLDDTRRRLAEQMKLRRSEVDSLIQLMRSQLDASLGA